MRQNLLAAIVAFVIGGIAAGAALSHAQPAPPPSQLIDSQMPHPGPHMGMMGWGHRMGHHRPFNQRAFALIYPQGDRQLAAADVQKIAEGFLLWNGNHTWKVANVVPAADGPIGFSFTTPDGSVVARFTMDPHSGQIERVG